jgi:hypothetical protein
MLPNDWPFEDPPNVATLTLRRIMQGHAPIRYVRHDADDGMWQFLDGEQVTEHDAMLVGLAEILSHDSTIAELADLPPGWWASRASIQTPWQRGPRDPA